MASNFQSESTACNEMLCLAEVALIASSLRREEFVESCFQPGLKRYHCTFSGFQRFTLSLRNLTAVMSVWSINSETRLMARDPNA